MLMYPRRQIALKYRDHVSADTGICNVSIDNCEMPRSDPAVKEDMYRILSESIECVSLN